MADHLKYINGYRKKIKKEKKENEILFDKLNKKARKTAIHLGKKYKLEKVYLFGSLVNKNNFHKDSDIDLAVIGLDSKEYLDAWGELEKVLNHSFDLVQLEKANNSLKKIIEEEGILLYES